GFDLVSRDLFEKPGAGKLVRVLSPRRIHEDIGVDQDHGKRSLGLGTDSRFMLSGSPTGRRMAVNSRTAANRASCETSPYCASQAFRTSSPKLVPRFSAKRTRWSWRAGGNRMVVFFVSSIGTSICVVWRHGSSKVK